MINVLKSGGLGNNMFQFAYGYTTSKKLRTDFIYDTSLLTKYFELSTYNYRLHRYIRYFKYLFSLKFGTYITLDLNLDVEPIIIKEKARNNAIIYGYFQSESYFHDQFKQVKKHFRIKKQFTNSFFKKYKVELQKPCVCIAIRMTDYLTWKIEEIDYQTPELSIKYFKKIIDSIDLNGKTVFVTSDDIDIVKEKIQLKEAIYIDNEIDSLLALMHSQINVISNSSFHWWGSWLNEIPHKIVYAPKYWLGHKVKREYPKEVIPPNWIQIQV